MDTRVGLIRFSDTAKLEFGFTTYNDTPSLISAVSNLKLEGGDTSYTAAFQVANNNLWTHRRQNILTICIFITDGQPNIDTDQTYEEINATKDIGIKIFAIGVTDKVWRQIIFQVSRAPFSTKKPTKITLRFVIVLIKACNSIYKLTIT